MEYADGDLLVVRTNQRRMYKAFDCCIITKPIADPLGEFSFTPLWPSQICITLTSPEYFNFT